MARGQAEARKPSGRGTSRRIFPGPARAADGLLDRSPADLLAEAETLLARSQALQPGHLESFFNRGVGGNMGRMLSAKFDFDVALALEQHQNDSAFGPRINRPMGQNIACNLGVIFYASGQLDDALKNFKACITSPVLDLAFAEQQMAVLERIGAGVDASGFESFAGSSILAAGGDREDRREDRRLGAGVSNAVSNHQPAPAARRPAARRPDPRRPGPTAASRSTPRPSGTRCSRSASTRRSRRATATGWWRR